MDQLPFDIVREILACCSVRSIIACCTVSSNFTREAQDMLYYTVHLDGRSVRLLVANSFHNIPLIRELHALISLRNISEETESAWVYLFQVLKEESNLRSLTLCSPLDVRYPSTVSWFNFDEILHGLRFIPSLQNVMTKLSSDCTEVDVWGPLLKGLLITTPIAISHKTVQSFSRSTFTPAWRCRPTVDTLWLRDAPGIHFGEWFDLTSIRRVALYPTAYTSEDIEKFADFLDSLANSLETLSVFSTESAPLFASFRNNFPSLSVLSIFLKSERLSEDLENIIHPFLQSFHPQTPVLRTLRLFIHATEDAGLIGAALEHSPPWIRFAHVVSQLRLREIELWLWEAEYSHYSRTDRDAFIEHLSQAFAVHLQKGQLNVVWGRPWYDVWPLFDGISLEDDSMHVTMPAGS